MPTAELPSKPPASVARKRDARAVLNALQEFCDTLQPGDTVPTHTELMRRLDASERAVRWALDELRREGVVVRRSGSGTFIAEPKSNLDQAASPVQVPSGQRLIDQGTVVVIATPDQAFFDRALSLLYRHTELQELSLVCRLLDASTGPAPLLRSDDKPLGFIIFRRDLATVARQLSADGHRVVLVGAPLVGESLGVPNVYGDHEQGGYLAAKHLLDLGHDRLAFCGDEVSVLTQRLQGHLRAVREAKRRGRPVISTHLPLSQLESWKKDVAGGRNYFAAPNRPTGITVWNDHEAVLMHGVLTHLNIRVPHDVSIVGYDNLPEGLRSHPSLSTVDSAIDAQLQAAVTLLTRENQPGADHSVAVLPTMIRRDSSAATPGSVATP